MARQLVAHDDWRRLQIEVALSAKSAAIPICAYISAFRGAGRQLSVLTYPHRFNISTLV